MHAWLAKRMAVNDLPALIHRCSDLAAPFDQPNCTVMLIEVIQEVLVTRHTIEVRLSEPHLQIALGIADTANGSRKLAPHNDIAGEQYDSHRSAESDPLVIRVTSHLLRCGKQVKLVLGQNPSEPAKTNPELIEMITKTRRWYNGLTSGRYATLRAIAKEEHRDKSYVSRILSIAFLAPDIVGRILTGDHSGTLTPERLRRACPLPMRWEEQRAVLID